MDASEQAMKPCPFCGEKILSVAVKCRFCGEIVAGPGGVGSPPPRVPRKSGMSAVKIFLLVVGVGGGLFVVISIIAAIAIPSLLRSRIAANEVSAQAALKQLVSTEGVWRQTASGGSGAQNYWTRDVAAFYYLKDRGGTPLKYIDVALANADKDGVSRWAQVLPVPKNGYWFVAIPLDASGKPYCLKGKDENPSAYGFCAWPSQYNKAGVHTYIVNEAGVVYQKDTGGQAVQQWPGLDPTTQGWVAAD